MQLGIRQHGDSVLHDFVRGLPTTLRTRLDQMWWPGSWVPDVVVCNSEPGAWSVPRPMYQTAPCPPQGVKYKIGRTVFETDRIPSGWPSRLNQMDEIWVPSPFSVEIFKAAGVTVPVLAMPEPVDTNFFKPGGKSELLQPEYPVKFLSVFKWERRKVCTMT